MIEFTFEDGTVEERSIYMFKSLGPPRQNMVRPVKAVINTKMKVDFRLVHHVKASLDPRSAMEVSVINCTQ